MCPQAASLQALSSDPDPALRALASEEAAELREKIASIEQSLLLTLLPRDADDERSNIIVEVRAGAGGDEAALFAGELLSMYQRCGKMTRWMLECHVDDVFDV